MASIPLSISAVDAVKKNLREFYSDCKSSFLTESLAAALGFNTHAALLSEIEKQGRDPFYRLLNEDLFNNRLKKFEYEPVFDFNFEDVRTPDMIVTDCSHAYKFVYDTKRKLAWRNLTICAVNEALRRRLFSLRPGVNLWPGCDSELRKAYLFDFELPCNLPARVAISDAGFDEISIHVAVNPKDEWVRAFNGDFRAGDAFAMTWLERQNGAWIQTNESSLRCRMRLLPLITDMAVEPLGYGDRGRVIM